MADKNNIDQFFKDQLGGQEFAFNEQAWIAMETMLKKKKRRAIIWWFTGAGVLLFSTSLFLYNLNYTKSLTEKKVVEKETQVVNEQKVAQEITPSNVENIKHNQTPKQNTESVVVENNVDKGTGVEKQSTIAYKLNQTKAKQLDISESKNTNTQTDVALKKTQEQAINGTPVTINNEQTTNNELPKNEQVDTSSEKPEPEIQNTKYKSQTTENAEAKSFFLSKLRLRKTNQIPVQDYEELGLAAEQKLPLIDRMNWIRKASLGVIGGGNLSRGFMNTGNIRPIPSLRPIGGLRLSYVLQETVSLDVNVLYRTRAALNSSRIQFNDLGLQTTTESTSLSYLDFPIYINYRSDRHGILFGLQYSHFLGVKESVIQEVATDGVISEETSTQFSKTSAFSNSDVGALVGYEYLLTEKLNFGARLNYGIFDVTENSTFRNTQIDNNLEIRLTLDYTIFRY